MKLFIILLTLPLLLFAAPLRLLVIVGGHEFEEQPFFEMFDAMPDIRYQTVTQPAANDLFASARMDSVDALVFYDMVQEITPAQQAAFIALLERGTGMVFLHHSLASYQAWDEFTRIRGGRYVLPELLPEAERAGASNYQHDVQVNVQIVDPQHPVTQGVADFELHDEVYGNFVVHPESVPLLHTDHPQSSPVIGWTTRYGASKIVYLQPGHDRHAYQDVHYRRLLENAVRWVAE